MTGWPLGVSTLAYWIKAECSSAGTSRHSASRSATCLDGRRSPASILTIVSSEQPTRRARSPCVRSSARRRCFSHIPNELLLCMVLERTAYCRPSSVIPPIIRTFHTSARLYYVLYNHLYNHRYNKNASVRARFLLLLY